MLMSALLLTFNAVTAFADETTEAVSDTTGSINFIYECDGAALSGAGISITKVADAKEEQGTVVYTLGDTLSAYSETNAFGFETFFDDMTALESNQTAALLASENLTADFTGTTDTDGSVTFSELPLGMYLVTQISSDGVSADYTQFEPFLISVPSMDEDGTIYTDLESRPKTDVEKIPETTTAPETQPTTPAPTVPTTDAPGTPIAGLSNEMFVKGVAFLAGACALLACAGTAFILFLKGKKA
jgi:hypothetical protein